MLHDEYFNSISILRISSRTISRHEGRRRPLGFSLHSMAYRRRIRCRRYIRSKAHGRKLEWCWYVAHKSTALEYFLFKFLHPQVATQISRQPLWDRKAESPPSKRQSRNSQSSTPSTSKPTIHVEERTTNVVSWDVSRHRRLTNLAGALLTVALASESPEASPAPRRDIWRTVVQAPTWIPTAFATQFSPPLCWTTERPEQDELSNSKSRSRFGARTLLLLNCD